MSERPPTGPTPHHDPILAAQLARIEDDLADIKRAIQGKLGDSATGLAGRQAANEVELSQLRVKVAALEAAQATKKDKTLEMVVNAGVSVLVALTVTMATRTVFPDPFRPAAPAATQGGQTR